MTIDYREGDLFMQRDVRALAHGVNCRGVMGAGIAVMFRKLYTNMYDQYANMCAYRALRPGDVMTWYNHHKVIFNLATQDLPGADARLDALEVSLAQALDTCEDLGITSLGVPRIGAGIGGLKWEDVRDLYERAALLYPDVNLVVVTHPADAAKERGWTHEAEGCPLPLEHKLLCI